MKTVLAAWGKLRPRLSSRGLISVLVIALVLAPVGARAGGVGNILSLIKTITDTLQNAIGSVLSEIQSAQTAINNYRQRIIWPLDELNQVRAFVSATRARSSALMSQVHSIQNNSASLVNPKQLESLLRGGQAGGMGQFQQLYQQVYSAVPDANAARPIQREMMDIDDALAMDALKTTVISDQATAQLLTLADSLEQQSTGAAPGSAPLLTAQARVTDLVTQAQLAKLLAAELRQEAAKLAHQNALLKQSAATTRNLQNQMQHVLKHP